MPGGALRANESDQEPPRTPDCVRADPALWGKMDGPEGRYPLLCHMLDTSAAALVLWDLWLRPGLRQMITAALAPGDEPIARALCAAIAGLHDVGKATKVFQGQLLNPRASGAFGPVVDELAGVGYDMTASQGEIAGVRIPEVYRTVLRRHEASSLFVTSGSWPTGDELVSERWAGVVVGGHHGRYHPRFGGSKPADTGTTNRYLTRLGEEKWGDQQRAHFDAVLAACGVSHEQILRPLANAQSSTVTILLTGLVMLADWLSSGDDSVADGRAVAIDQGADPSGWVKERRIFFETSIPKTLGIYEDLPDPLSAIMGVHAASMSPLQVAARSIGRGLWIATETTGAGKTEAGMLRHVAVPGEGLMFALPTRATTDAMFDRMAGYYSTSKNAASLLHAHRSLNSFYMTEASEGAGLRATSWLTDTRNALFAPVSVGTCDQVLLGGLKQKNTPVRLLALANRHVVLDEVHSFDHYQAALLEELLAWWGETDTRVTLLSASLPESVTRRYAQAYAGADILVAPFYPGHLLVTAAGASGSPVVSQRNYELRVRLQESPAGDLIAAHVARALEYRRCSPDARIAVVVNQVDRALEVGRILAESGHRTIVLHSRMAAGHRNQITRDLNEAVGKDSGQGGVIVVGTQIIESSLDLDFDCMITDLAPAPSLIQRAGRLWRSTPVVDGVWGRHRVHRPTATPTLDVILAISSDGTVDQGAALPYLPGELRRTLTALRELGEIVKVPEDVQHLVDDASFDPFDTSTTFDDAVDTDMELIKAGQKLMAARYVIVPMHHKHGSGRVLRAETTHRDLGRVTEPDELAESSTRHIERPTVDCFIVAADGPSRWVWRAETATALQSRDRNVMRSVLALSFPLAPSRISPQNGLERIPGFELTDEAGMRKRGPLQRQLVPVKMLAGTVYDDVLGLRLIRRVAN